MGDNGLSFSFIVKLLLLLLKISDNVIEAQKKPTINILHLNELGNTAADKAIKLFAAEASNIPSLNANIILKGVSANRTDAEGFIDKICKKYETMLQNKMAPHLVLDTTLIDVASEVVKGFTYVLALPTVSASFGQPNDLKFWSNLDPARNQYLIQIVPPADTIIDIVRLLITTQNCPNAAILFDNSFVMDFKYKTLLQNVATRHVVAPVNETNIAAQIYEIIELEIMNFFILARVPTIKKILKVVDKLNLYERKYGWYGITQDKSDVGYTSINATYMFIKPIVNSNHLKHIPNKILNSLLKNELQIASVFYFELIYQSVIAVRDMILEKAWIKNMKYLKCSEYDEKRSLARTGLDLKKYFIKPSNNGLLRIKQNGQSQMNFEMQLSGIKKGTSSKPENIGTWNARPDSNFNNAVAKVMKTYASRVMYRVVVVIQEPFVNRNNSVPKKFDGYCINLLDEIAKILDFDYVVDAVKDNKFGFMDDNGTWNGIIRELLDKNADIGLGAMSVMAERERVIDFTVPFYDLVGISILMKVHLPNTSLFKFLTVIEEEIWLTIFAGYFLVTILIYIFDRWSPYSYRNNKEQYKNDDDNREFHLLECLWFCITSLTPQGGGDAPKNVSGRFVSAMWWFYGFIIVNSYTAYLAAFLTVARLEPPITSVDDLAKQYRLEYAALNDSMTMRYFKRMADVEERFYHIWKNMTFNDSLSAIDRANLSVWEYPVRHKFTKVWNAMKKTGLPANLEEAVARVRTSRSVTDGFAFIGDAADLRFLQMTNCDLRMVGEEFSRKPFALAVQQGSPLKDVLNSAILQLLNRRALEKYKERWWSENPKTQKCEKIIDQLDSIDIQSVGGMFIIIMIGAIIACITLGFEYRYIKNLNKIENSAEARNIPQHDTSDMCKPPATEQLEYTKIPKADVLSKF